MSESTPASTQVNPYQANPIDATVARQIPILTWRVILRLLAVVAICTMAGAIVGVAAGVFVAVVSPNYYIQVFGLSPEAADCMSMGVGLGMTQGIGGGAAVGVVVDLIAVWYLTRMTRLLTKAGKV